jgi:hypothetical protein
MKEAQPKELFDAWLELPEGDPQQDGCRVAPRFSS